MHGAYTSHYAVKDLVAKLYRVPYPYCALTHFARKSRGNASVWVSGSSEDKKFSLANVTLIFAIILMLCTVSFFAGAMLSGYSPPWITQTRASSALASSCSCPPGVSSS